MTDTIYGKVTPIKDRVLAYDLEFGEQKRNGIIFINDDMTYNGIRARWCRVYAVGPKIDNLKQDQYILVDHARWSRGFNLDDGSERGPVLVRWVDYMDIFLVSDERPGDYKAI